MICRIFRCHLALFAMKLNLYLPLRYFNHPELSAINLSLHWLTRHGCESVNTKWDSFTTFQEYFNFSIVEMSVPWLMKYLKYCPHQIYELDLIFHISSFTRGLGSFFYQTHPQFCSPAHVCLVLSLHVSEDASAWDCLLLCLTGYRSWCRYVTRWWYVCHHPIPQPPHCHWAAPVSHSPLSPPRCCGQFRSGL